MIRDPVIRGLANAMFESAALRYEAEEKFPDIKVGTVEYRECMRGSLVT
jgi:hypothetical protein